MHETTYAATSLVQPTATLSPADCPGAAVSFTLVQTPTNTAYDSNYITAAGGFKVDTQNNAYIGLKTYAWVASIPTTAILIGKSKQADITISIIGCLTTPMQPSPAGPGTFIYEINPLTIAAQSYSLPSYATTPCDYAYSILIERTDNPSSPIPFSWSATSSQITYSGTVDTSLAGVQTYKITATQTYMCPSQAPLTNSSYTFSFILACRVTQLTPTDTMADIAEKLNDQTLKTHAVPTFTSTPSNCGATYTLSLRYLINNVVQPLPGFLAIDNVTKQLKIDLTALSTAVGTYDLQIKATADTTQTVIGSGIASQWLAFKLVITCDVTPLPPTMSNIEYPVAGSFYQALTIEVPPFTFTPSVCVSSYTWSLSSIPNAYTFVKQAGNPPTVITINTTNALNVALFTVTVTALPTKSTYLKLLTPAEATFKLNVYKPCFVTSVRPQSQITFPFTRLLNNLSPSSFVMPKFDILPTQCKTVMLFKLYETTSGTDVQIATFDEATATKTTTDNLISLDSGTVLVFSHTNNLDAKSRTFKLQAEVVSTPQIQGLVTSSPLLFTVNLVCTIEAITIANPDKQYCHGALEPLYSKTPLKTPVLTLKPSNCPGAVAILSLVNADQADAAYDPTYIKQNGPDYVIDTQSPSLQGVKNYSWIATVPTTSILAGLTNRSDFQITIRGCISTLMKPSSPGPDAFTYEVDPTNAVTKTFQLPSYLFTSNSCLNSYEIFIVRTDANKQTIPIPFTWSPTSGQISYTTTDTSLVEVQNYRIDSTQTCTCQSQVPLTDSSFVFSFTIKCRIAQLTPTAAISEIQESIFDQTPKTYKVPLFAITPSDCGATYQLQLEYLVDGVKQVNLPSFIALDGNVPNQLNIDLSNKAATLGSYSFRIVAISQSTATVIGGVTSSITFDFIRHDKCEQIQLLSPLPVQQTYTIDSTPINLPFPQYQFTPAGCTFNIQYQATLVTKVPDPVKGQSAPFNKQSQNLPNFFSWDPAKGIEIKGSDFSESWNNYLIKITAIDDRTGLFDQNFALNVTTVVDCINGAEFNPVVPIPSTFEYKIAYPALTYTFDVLSDLKSVKASVPSVCGPVVYRLNSTDQQGEKINLLPDFISYNQTARHFEISTTLASKAGTYYLLLDVFYGWFEASLQALHLKNALKLTLVDPKAPIALNTTSSTMITANSTQAVPIQSLMNNSNSEPIQEAIEDQEATQPIKTKDQASLLPMELRGFLPEPPKPKKIDQKVQLRFADVYISSLDQSGKLILQMMEEVNLTNEGQKIDADMLSITFYKNSDEDLKMTGWDLISYTKTQIQIQLNFSSPLLVSTGQLADQVEIFLSKKLFLPVNEPYKLVPVEDPPEKMEMKLTKDLPLQMPSQKAFQTLENVQNTVGKSATVTMVMTILLQLVLKGAMKRLWFYFNTIQLASTYTEFNLVKVPANVSMVQKSYEKIIHVKLIPDQLMVKIKANLGFNPAEDQQTELETQSATVRLLAAMNSKQILKNRIIFGSFMVLIAIGIGLTILFRKRIWARLPRLAKRLLISFYESMIWNGIIRALLELFYPTVLVALITIMANRNDLRNIAMPVLQLVFYVGFLIVTVIHIEAKKNVIDTEEYKSKCGAYFTNVETYKKPKALHYSSIFLARRLVIAIAIACLKSNNVLQSLVAVFSSLSMLSWLIDVMPLDTKVKNYLEMTNEFLVTILGYFGFLFTDYVSDPLQRYTFGYIYIGLVAGGLLFNIIYMGYTTIKDFLYWWKVKRHLKSAKKPDPEPEQLPEQPKPDGNRSIFLKLMKNEPILPEDWPQRSQDDLVVADPQQAVARPDQPPKVVYTAEMIDKFYREPLKQKSCDDLGQTLGQTQATGFSIIKNKTNRVGILLSQEPSDIIFQKAINFIDRKERELDAIRPQEPTRKASIDEEEEKVPYWQQSQTKAVNSALISSRNASSNLWHIFDLDQSCSESQGRQISPFYQGIQRKTSEDENLFRSHIRLRELEQELNVRDDECFQPASKHQFTRPPLTEFDPQNEEEDEFERRQRLNSMPLSLSSLEEEDSNINDILDLKSDC